MSVEHYTIKDLAEAKGTSAPVRAALLALEARVLDLEEALSWSLIQLGSETGYNMESPVWHAYDRARDILNGVKQ